MSRVIMFVFAGRQANMELQLPFVRRILAENPDVEYHVWNLCRDPRDVAFLHTIEGERITVRDDFYDQPSWNSWDQVYRHYTHRQYEGCVFVKLDDDVVFLETHRFARFVEAIEEYPRAVLSANVVNNGACTAVEPGLKLGFDKLAIPLLDVHASNAYGDMAHRYFFDNADELLAQPIRLVPTEDWLSINLIGYGWEMGVRLEEKLGIPTPQVIAGRRFHWTWRLGDEGCVNLFPRIIMRGFVAGHLTFGPQHPTKAQLKRWRAGYAELWQGYEGKLHQDDGAPLPDLSPPAGLPPVAKWSADNWRMRRLAPDEDPVLAKYR